MSTIVYTEDAFIFFYQQIYTGIVPINDRDHSAILNFYKIISNNDPLTENQAKYIIRLLKKYRDTWDILADNLNDAIDHPRWRQEFRKIDLTKEIFVEVEDGVPWICLKFPYMLKDSFEKEILKETETFLYTFGDDQYWDKERKIRKLNLYNYNILQIQDFVQRNGFKIHESFVEAVNLIDEIWGNKENILKRSKIVNDKVHLINADQQILEFFENNRKNFQSDLLLAKSMGYILENRPTTLIEKIVSSEENWFWHRDLGDVIEICSSIEDKTVFLLDRSSNYKDWLKEFKFLLDYKKKNIETRICFRQNNNDDAEFNRWISENKFGGKVDEGKFLVFLQKPNKWLFNNIKEVKIIITNSVYPPNDQIAINFLQSHPCVFFVGDVKPTDPRGRKIVEL